MRRKQAKNRIASSGPFLDGKTEATWDEVRRFGERYKTFDWPTVRLFLSYLYTLDAFSKHFARRFKTVGLSSGSFNVLVVLSRSEGRGCKQREISRLMLVSRANVTGLIDHLVRLGLVERVADERDRRVWIAKITEKGDSLLESFLPGHYAEMKRLMAPFNNSEKNRFFVFLTKLRENLS